MIIFDKKLENMIEIADTVIKRTYKVKFLCILIDDRFFFQGSCKTAQETGVYGFRNVEQGFANDTC